MRKPIETYCAAIYPRDHAPDPRKLLDPVRDRIGLKRYSCHTEQFYVEWVKRFILSHDKRHPREMANLEIESFLTHFADDRNVAQSN